MGAGQLNKDSSYKILRTRVHLHILVSENAFLIWKIFSHTVLQSMYYVFWNVFHSWYYCQNNLISVMACYESTLHMSCRPWTWYQFDIIGWYATENFKAIFASCRSARKFRKLSTFPNFLKFVTIGYKMAKVRDTFWQVFTCLHINFVVCCIINTTISKS